MKCSRIQLNLSDYSRGLLSEKEAEKVASHLAVCAECRKVFEEESRLAGLFASVGMREPLRDVWPLVEAGVRADNRSSLLDKVEVWFRIYRRRLAAAAVAVVVVCGTSVSISLHNSAVAAEAEKARAREAVAMMGLQLAGVDQQTSTTETMISVLENQVP